MTVMTDERPETAADDNGGAILRTWPYRFDVVPIEQLFVDGRYQRELTSLADEIGEEFNPAMVGTLIASERHGGKESPKGPQGRLLAVVDGQTRFRGAEKAGVTELPCLIYEGMTIADEAELFAQLQRKRRNIATYQRFRAALVAQDPMAQDIAKILKKFGLEVGPKKDSDIQAVAALESVWKRDHHIDDDGTLHRPPDGPSLLERTINILHTAWADEATRDAYAADMIRGVARFIADEGVDEARLIKRLANTNPGKLKIRAGMLREGKGGGGHTSTYMADALLTEYTRRG